MKIRQDQKRKDTGYDLAKAMMESKDNVAKVISEGIAKAVVWVEKYLNGKHLWDMCRLQGQVQRFTVQRVAGLGSQRDSRIDLSTEVRNGEEGKQEL